MIRNSLFLGACLFLALPAFAADRAPPLDEASARIIHVSANSGTPAHQSITLGMGKSAVVELDTEAHDVMVSSPEIVDAVVRNPKRIFLLGLKTGQTNAFFFDGAGHQILSLDVRVEKDVTDLAAMMKADLPNSAIKVTAMNDTVVLSGSVSSAQEASRAQDLAVSFAGDVKKVVNMLGVTGNQQVMLKVRIAEMDRNIAKQFGISTTSEFNAGGVPIAIGSVNPYGLLGKALSDATGVQIGQEPIPNNVQGTLNLMETVGLVHMLAEPNLTAVSGETARFLAGGEFPIPAARDNNGNITVDYKQFGVGLSFTPVVLSSGNISLQISTESSELTTAGSYQIGSGANALTVPALAVRRAQTTVELPSGGTFAIAGLLQHNSKQTIEGLPGAKDLPVLGALFRSRDYQNDETELVVLASVYLAQPGKASDYAAPTDGFQPPSDPETILMGRLNTLYKKSDSPMTPQASAPVGFVVR